ncbi:MAG: SOS response-associated peptidase [Gemmatimonadota bacterium]
MCGRYGFGNPARLGELPLGATLPPSVPRFNIGPMQQVPLVLADRSGREATMARWGLVPAWADDPSIGNRLCNARGDTVAEKPSFRSAFKSRRGLMPAEFFFEWQPIEGQKVKQPWCIALEDGEPFVFAALWERWTPKGDADAEPLVTCAVITTEPNETMAPIHNRMPVILRASDYEQWLDPATTVTDARALVRPYDGPMRAWRVSTRVNKVGNEGGENIQPVDMG